MICNLDKGFLLKCSQHAPISDFCWVVHTHASSREREVPNSNDYTIKMGEGRDEILPLNQVDGQRAEYNEHEPMPCQD